MFVRLCCMCGLAVAAALLPGCATLFKETAEQINVVGPDDVTILVDDTVAVPVVRRDDGSRYIELPSDTEHRLTVRGGERSDTMRLQRGVHPGYAMLDAGTLLIGLVVDASTGAWLSFNGQGIAYLNDTNAAYLERQVGWNLLKRNEIAKFVPPQKLGLAANIFINHLSFPIADGTMAPILFITGLGGMATLRLNSTMEIGASVDVAFASDYAGLSSGYESVSYGGGLFTRTYQVVLRRPFEGGAYITGGVGVTYTENLVRETQTGFRDFWVREWVPSGSASLGFRSGLWFGELRMLAGLLPVELDSRGRATLLMFTLRSGLNIEV